MTDTAPASRADPVVMWCPDDGVDISVTLAEGTVRIAMTDRCGPGHQPRVNWVVDAPIHSVPEWLHRTQTAYRIAQHHQAQPPHDPIVEIDPEEYFDRAVLLTPQIANLTELTIAVDHHCVDLSADRVLLSCPPAVLARVLRAVRAITPPPEHHSTKRHDP